MSWDAVRRRKSLPFAEEAGVFADWMDVVDGTWHLLCNSKDDPSRPPEPPDPKVRLSTLVVHSLSAASVAVSEPPSAICSRAIRTSATDTACMRTVGPVQLARGTGRSRSLPITTRWRSQTAPPSRSAGESAHTCCFTTAGRPTYSPRLLGKATAAGPLARASNDDNGIVFDNHTHAPTAALPGIVRIVFTTPGGLHDAMKHDGHSPPLGSTSQRKKRKPQPPAPAPTATCYIPGGLGAGPSGLTRPPLDAPDRTLVRED